MFLSWYRGVAQVAASVSRKATRRPRIAPRVRRRMAIEVLENRLTPSTTTLSLTSGLSGGSGSTVGPFPVNINSLQDETGAYGLASATFAITYPTGVFAFPVGGNLATSDVLLGSIPLGDAFGGKGQGANNWTITANSPSDGTLDISLSAKSGQAIVPVSASTPTLAAGGALTVGTQYFYVVTPTFGTGANLAEGIPQSVPLTATPTTGNQSVKLTWTAVTGASGYRIYRSTSATFGATSKVNITITSGTTTTATDTGAATIAGTPPTSAANLSGSLVNISFPVSNAYNVAGAQQIVLQSVSGSSHTSVVGTVNGSNSTATFVLDPAPPSNGSITITSTAAVAPTVASPQSYSTESNTPLFLGSPGTPSPVIGTPALSPNGGLTANTTYYYVVTALGPNGESAPSAQVLATPQAAVAATGQPSLKSVALTWQPVSGATGYNIYRSTTSNTFPANSLVTSVAGGTSASFTDTGSGALQAGSPPPTLFKGSTNPQEKGSDPFAALQVNKVNGSAYTLGTPVTLPSGASLTINANGAMQYVPAFNFVGTDSFTFTGADVNGNVSNSATVNIVVVPTVSIQLNTHTSGSAPFRAAPDSGSLTTTNASGSITNESASGTATTDPVSTNAEVTGLASTTRYKVGDTVLLDDGGGNTLASPIASITATTLILSAPWTGPDLDPVMVEIGDVTLASTSSFRAGQIVNVVDGASNTLTSRIASLNATTLFLSDAWTATTPPDAVTVSNANVALTSTSNYSVGQRVQVGDGTNSYMTLIAGVDATTLYLTDPWVGGTLTTPDAVKVAQTVEEDVILDNPNPPGGRGPLAGFNLAITYDKSTLVTAPDGSLTALGPNIPTDWTFTANTKTAGLVSLGAFGTGSGTDLVSGPVPVELVSMIFTVNSAAATGMTPLDVVAFQATTTGSGSTGLNGSGGTYLLNPSLPGTVIGLQLTGGGGGYTSTPGVTITGGGGQGAQATAVLLNGGNDAGGDPVIGLILTAQGNSYTSPPTVTIDPPPAGGTQATATGSISPFAIGSFVPGVDTTVPVVGSTTSNTPPTVTVTTGPGTPIVETQTETASGSFAVTTAGATVTSLTSSEGTVVPAAPGSASGTWSWSESPVLTDGAHTVTIIATDSNGLTGTTTFTFTVTDAPPTVGVSTSPTSPVAENTNVSATGTFADVDENVTALTASEGTLTPITAGPSGTWSWSENATLTDGAHTVTITATDADGLTSSTTFTFTVNDVKPTVAVSSSPTSAVPENTNASASGTFADLDDNVTKLTASEGTVAPPAPGTTSGTWTWSETAPLTDGAHTVTITATNADGSSGSTTFSFTVSDVNPTVTVTGSPTSPVPENTNASAGGNFLDYDDNVTKLAASEGTVTPTGIPGLSGNWSWSETAPLTDGAHTVTITATNADGSTGSTSFTFTVSDVNPTVAVTTSTPSMAENNAANASGTFADYDDNVTKVTASEGSVATITPGLSGTWSWSETAPLTDGAHTVTITATNADGSTSTTSFTFTANDVKPTVAVTTSPSGSITTVSDVSASGTFADYDDNVTKVTASEGSVATITPGLSGNWTWSETHPLSVGAHTVTITGTNADGSTGTTTFTFTVTGAGPTVAVTSSPTSPVPENTNASASGTYSDSLNVTSLTASEGTVAPPSPGNASGTWTWTDTAPLADGAHTVIITATDSSGITGQTTFTFTVSDVKPTVSVGAAVTFAGNGNTSFGGPIGTGSLTLSDDGTTLSGTITKGSNGFNDALVIYIQSGPGGFSDTSGFNDAGDGLRKAISGVDGGSNRSLLTFSGGFAPNFALALGPNDDSFGGLWQLANGGNNSLPFIASANLAPTGTSTAATYTFSIPLADLGITPGSGATIQLLGTYISDTGFRSAEAVAGNVSGTSGYTPFTQTAGASYATAGTAISVPENGTATNSGSFADYDDKVTKLTASEGTVSPPAPGAQSGNWTWSEAGPLTDGAHTVTITATNADGSTGTTSFTLTVTDVAPTVAVTSSPTAPVPENTNAGATGTFADIDDNITKLSASEGTVSPAAPGTSSGSWSWSELTPLTDGAHTVTITATNADGSTGTTSFTFTVSDVAPTVVVSSSPTGSVPENTNASASGTFADFDDNVTKLSASEGTVAPPAPGTLTGGWTWTETAPLGDGTHTVTITATNADGTTGSTTFTFKVSDVNPTVVVSSSPTSLPNTSNASASGTFGDYDDNVTSLTASEGTVAPPAPGTQSGNWTWTENAPLTNGAHTVTITAINADGSAGSTTFSFTVTGALQISPATLPNWDVNIAYTQTITASGGTSPYTFSTNSASLPTGLSLNASTGVLSGTPTATGPYSFTVTVTDGASSTASQAYKVTINPQPTISLTTLPNGQVGKGYSQTITVNGGTAPFTFTDALPPGLTLNSSTGVISGTPTTPGSYTFTVTVTDAAGGTSSETYTVTINAASGAFLSMPTMYANGTPQEGGTVTAFPISISQLFDNATIDHVGLASASIAITYPTGVFAFPVGSNAATSLVHLGAVPLSDPVSGGASNWQLIANSPSDGVLNISLTANTGKSFPVTVQQPTLGSGGTLTVGTTYYYVVTAVFSASGQTAPSGEVSATPTAGNQSVVLNWNSFTPQTGVTSYKIYRTTVSGDYASQPSLLATVTGNSTFTFTDDGSATPTAATPPNPYGGGTLVTINFPVSNSYNPPTNTNETITIVKSTSTNSNTQVVGTNGTYVLNPTVPYTGSITIKPVAQNPPTIVTPQNYVTESNTALNEGSTTPAPVVATPTLAAGGSLTVGTKYYYVVTAVAPGGESAWLSQVSATPTSGNQSVVLSWSPVSGATGYNVYRSTTSDNFLTSLPNTGLVGSVPGTSMTFTDDGSATLTAFSPPQTLLSGATDPQSQAMSINTINGAAFTPGSPITLPSGASLTVNSDGSFSYTSAPNAVGSDSFTFTVKDTGGNISTTGTAHIAITPTLQIVPITVSSGTTNDVIGEEIILDNPNSYTGVGPLEGFNLAVTYDPLALSTTASDVTVVDPNYTATINANTPGVVAIGAFVPKGGTPASGTSPVVLATINFTITATINQVTAVKLSPSVQAGAGTATTVLVGSTGNYTINPALNGALFVNGVDTTIQVNGGSTTVAFNPTTLPNGEQGVPYAQTINAVGGATGGPFTYSLTSGTIPPGLSLTTVNDPQLVISGTPTTPGTYTFTITATDGTTSGSQQYTIIIFAPVSITTTTLANWTVNQPGYSQQIHATGGDGNYTFSQTGGTLPNGLTLSSTGLLSGTPTVQGSFQFTVTANDDLGGSGSASYTVVINPAVQITTTTLVNWTVNAGGYNQTIHTTGGTGSDTFAVSSGTLPTGLTLSSAGVITGTPTVQGTFTFQITATDSVGAASAPQSYTVVINPAVTITTTTLPNWTANFAFSQTITATGGTNASGTTTGPYAWSKSAGTLPTGLTLNASTGVLSGTPTTAGTYVFTVTAKDSVGATGSESFTVTINPAVTVSTPGFVQWDVNVPNYSQTVTATGGTNPTGGAGGPYTFALASGTLPTGVTLNTASGVLSGTPTAAGTYTFTISATDSIGATGTSNSSTVVIASPLTITSTTLNNWTVNRPNYNQLITASGGTSPYTYSVSSGTLPTGLTLNASSGAITGTPTATGSYTFTIMVVDTFNAANPTVASTMASKSFTIVINPAVTITTTTLPNWTANFPGYSQTIATAGGTPPMTFTTSAGTLPPGLVLSGNSSGTTIFSDGFESYNAGLLDSNASGGANQAPNGTGTNPWFGPNPPNLHVVGAGGGLSSGTAGPHSGSHMVTGNALPNDGDEDWVNIAHRFNSGNNFSGNLELTWWFYDPVGAGNTGFQDYVALANYGDASTAAASGLDYTTADGGDLSQGTTIQRLSLGATSVTGSNANDYQARVVGATDGLNGGQWFNVGTRSVGWHEGEILLGSAQGANTSVSYFIDGVNVLTHAIDTTGGVNAIEMNASFGSVSANYDDVTLTSFQAAGTTGLLAGTPTTPGTYNFTIQAKDFAGSTATQSYTVTINPAVTITTTALPNGKANFTYPTTTITASGGTNASGTTGGPYTFSVSSGTLPTGLTLSSGGVLSGTPTTAGSFTFTVSAKDSIGATGSKTFTVVIGSIVYVDPSFAGTPTGGDPSTDPGLGLSFGTTAFATITNGLAAVGSGGTLVVFGAEYIETPLNFNVANLTVDLATNPSDSPVGTTVQLDSAVTVTNSATFDMTGVATGTGTSVAAKLNLVSTETGPGTMTVTGAAGVNFGGAISGPVVLSGTGGAPVLNATGNVTLTGSGSLTVGTGLGETTGMLVSPSSTSNVTLTGTGALTVDGLGSTTFAGTLSGAGTLNKAGAATSLTLTGNSTTFTGTVNDVGTLTVNGTLGTSTNPVNLTDPSSVLNGNGTVNMPVVVTGTGSGAVITSSGTGQLTIIAAGGTGIDVKAGANNVSISNVKVTGSSTGVILEPGDGNDASLTNSNISANTSIGLEPLNGCLTVTGNLINGDNTGVEIPATNPHNASLKVDPLLTLEGNDLSGNSAFDLMNGTSMGVTAILNWWGSTSGTTIAGFISGVSVDDYTPYALDTTSVGPNPTTFDYFNGTGTDGNVYVTPTSSTSSNPLGQNTISATVDSTNSNLVHVTVNTTTTNYLRGGATNRIIIYGFGDNVAATHSTISFGGDTLSAPWNAQINSEALKFREPLTFSGTSTTKVSTSGFGNDVIFGGGNDNIAAMTSGNNVIVAGLSTGKTGAPTAPQLSSGNGGNIFIAGYVDCTLAPLASTGRLDYEALSAIDALWATSAGGSAGAMSDAALYSIVNTPGAIMTGTARATIIPGSGQNWFITKGATNPVNTPSGINQDFVAAQYQPSTGSSLNYRQAIQ